MCSTSKSPAPVKTSQTDITVTHTPSLDKDEKHQELGTSHTNIESVTRPRYDTAEWLYCTLLLTNY